MTEQNKPAPPWKAALENDVLAAAIEVNLAYRRGDVQPWTPMTDAVMAAVLPHMETAYRTGRMAGASQAGYRLVQKNLELAKKLREIRNIALLGDLADVLSILGEDSP